MRSKHRSASRTRTSHLRVRTRNHTKQRGGSTTVVLIIALIAAAVAVGFLVMQISKFQKGRNGEVVLELSPSQEDQNLQMSLSPTAARKKGLLEGLFGKKEEPAQTEQASAPDTTPTPTIFVRPIQAGLLQFSISQGSEMAGPLFAKGVVSDFATAPNTTQTVTIYFAKSRPPQTVSAKLITDTKQTPISFSKQADEGDYEVWKGEWMLQDTNNVNMAINFEATNQQGTSIAGVAVR